MRTFAVISLGCDKNRVDSERILAMLNGDFALAEPEDADLVIVNTCAFIERAREEAVDTVLAAAARKKPDGKLMVVGCLAGLYAADIESGIPEVDAVVPISDYPRLRSIAAGLFGEHLQAPCAARAAEFEAQPRLLTTPPHYAYLKIADGCDNRCTYCMIPSLRGPYRSVPIDMLANEAAGLAADGVRELILVAQDVTRYGIDLYGAYRLPALLKRLAETEVQRLRLMYCYPELVTDELIGLLASERKIARYIDIPIQHISDRILKRMNRRSTGDSIRALFDSIRAADPDIAIRTTVMVGFPGETETDFAELYAFIETYRPDHVGVFAYSDEETPSARLRDKVPEDVKWERVERIGRLHLANTAARNGALVGRTLRVLYEDIDYERNMFRGRTEQNAPDIDTSVFFTADFAEAGQVYDVRITAADGYDLIGEVI